MAIGSEVSKVGVIWSSRYSCVFKCWSNSNT